MRKSVLRATVALGVMLSPMLVAGPAAAARYAPWNLFSTYGTSCIPSFSNCKAAVDFHPDGDHVYLRDLDEDGYGVRLRVKNVTKDPDVTDYTLTNTRGAGEFVHVSASTAQRYDLAETHCFRFTMWLIDNGEQVGEKYYNQIRNYNNDGPEFCVDVE